MGRFLDPGHEVDGKYAVVRLLGFGGMGQVYEAEDRLLGRRVALKVLPERAQGDQEARERLVREGRAAARIQHRNVVRIYEVGSDGETDYLAMELLDGEDLYVHMKRYGVLGVEHAHGLFLELSEALIAMHEAGVVHRDLKPRNLFLARDGSETPVLKVLDFGVAKHASAQHAELTHTGQVFGTLDYMAPEQLRSAKHADARSDLWAAGAILYEALGGRPPFQAETPAELVLSIASDLPPDLASLRADVPDYLRAIIERCLTRQPSARFQTASELRAALLSRTFPALPRSDGASSLPLSLATTASGSAGTDAPSGLEGSDTTLGEARASYAHGELTRGRSMWFALAFGLLVLGAAASLLKRSPAAEVKTAAPNVARPAHLLGEPALPSIEPEALPAARPEAGLPQASPTDAETERAPTLPSEPSPAVVPKLKRKSVTPVSDARSVASGAAVSVTPPAASPSVAAPSAPTPVRELSPAGELDSSEF
ncbi:MAG: protein kinase [Myxococcales bacterium]